MSDILDFIRERLTGQPGALALVEPVLSDARMVFGGDTVYVRAPRIRDLAGGSVREIAARNRVSRRTAQRWMREPRP